MSKISYRTNLYSPFLVKVLLTVQAYLFTPPQRIGNNYAVAHFPYGKENIHLTLGVDSHWPFILKMFLPPSTKIAGNFGLFVKS